MTSTSVGIGCTTNGGTAPRRARYALALPALLLAAAVLAVQAYVPMQPGAELLASVACGAAAYIAAAAALLQMRLPPALTSKIVAAAE